MRILLSAYYCSPYRGGESAVGWNVATGLAKHHDVTVICGDLSADSPTGRDIQRFKKEQCLPPGLEIHHVQAEGLTLKIHDAHSLPGLWFLYYEAYRRWQLQALDLARRLQAAEPFDLVHHVNVIGFREPGYLWRMGIPFFWGPVSGAPMVPPAFLGDFSPKERFRWSSRNIVNRFQILRGGRPAEAARTAAKVWAVSREDQAALAGWGVRAEPMLEGGTAGVAAGAQIKNRGSGEPLRVCWSGLFQGIKELPILLRAIASFDPEDLVVEILGDGPEANRWKALAESLGLGARLHWHGMLPRDQALSVMDRCHVLAHTSIKEATAIVLMEALERGLPVICHDACGMATAINQSCGILVPLVDPATSVEGFRQAFARLLTEPDAIGILSTGALSRARELSWEEKIQRFSKAYRQVSGDHLTH